MTPLDKPLEYLGQIAEVPAHSSFLSCEGCCVFWLG